MGIPVSIHRPVVVYSYMCVYVFGRMVSPESIVGKQCKEGIKSVQHPPGFSDSRPLSLSQSISRWSAYRNSSEGIKWKRQLDLPWTLHEVEVVFRR